MIRRVPIDGRKDDPSVRRNTNDLIRATEANVLTSGDPRVKVTHSAGGTKISLAPKRQPNTKTFELVNGENKYYFTEMTEDGFAPVEGGLRGTSSDLQVVEVKFLRGSKLGGNPTPYLTDLVVNAHRKKSGPGLESGDAPGTGPTWYISASLGLRDPSFDMVADASDHSGSGSVRYGSTSIDQKSWHMDSHVNTEPDVADGSASLPYTSVAGVTVMGMTRMRLSSTDHLAYAYHRSYQYDSMGHLVSVSAEKKAIASPSGTLFVVNVTKTTGVAGGATSQCTFKYTATGLSGSGSEGESYGVNLTPAVQRPPLGAMLYGNGPVGVGYITVLNSVATFTLLSAGEAPDSGACD